MSIYRRFKNKQHLWKCDICGKIDFWSDDWSYYGSIIHQETCPGELPCSCSEKCKKELQEKINAGDIQLPILRNEVAGAVIIKKRIGY